MYTEQREQFLWKQVHLNWSTKYRLLNNMEMLPRFLPDPLGGQLSVKTRGSYLLHKIQLSPVAPYSWMTCHQKLPFSSGMQENCPFPFICTLRAHGACRNLLWSLLLLFFFNPPTISESHSRAETNTAVQLSKLFSNFPYKLRKYTS